ncbi:unnamed protein product [Arctia plantaginis]|uniref:Uncharacterized protein n=1 Tax=Arctia plantaginis TaxID=874455 RepID=A0A8S1AF18_ARCPL|nr:unnamed protein product [Arctia plantaginis]
MTSPANSSSGSSPQRMRGRPKKRDYISNNGASSNASLNTSVRVSERHKVAKKVFDPSDNNVPSKRKRGRPVGSLNKKTIEKGLLKAGHHKSGAEGAPPSESQVALDGSNKTMQSSSGILKSRPDNTWQGPHRKACVVSCDIKDVGILTVCSSCSDAFHALCHLPCIPKRLQAWDQWQCSKCMLSRLTVMQSPAIIGRSVDYTAQSTLPTDPFWKPHELDRAPSKLADNLPVDLSIPDVTNWTADDVYNYFTKYLPEAALILKEQEYDGKALSTARREDIVRGLGLPLGPALALYRIIVKLQTRKDDWTMCWG